MTEEEAQRLRAERASAQPQYVWMVQCRSADEWVVVRLPGPARRAAPTGAQKGEPREVRDDPRPTGERNVPPYGG